MSPPTIEDAHLFLKLVELAQTPEQTESRRWFRREFKAQTYEQFTDQCPPGSPEREKLTSLLDFFEAAGVLVSRGLLHEDIFFDASFGLEWIWPRVGSIVEEWQKAESDTSIFENLQWLGRRHQVWHEKVWRAKLEAVPVDRPPTREWGETSQHVGFSAGRTG
jgi:hypothetical protein